ncbi:MAG: T9SS type A sorting domain-containing protein [Thermoanaerobaculia bacterium]|nr:T9SS type A sorting domain-containing protein [Thermoanaerobaculia bacterium]
MKKYFTCLLLWSVLASVLPGQSLSFTRTYGNGFYDDARGIAATPDGGFVFTGLNKSDDIDPDGRLLRQVTFEGNEYFLQRGGLSAGTYLINVSSKDGVLLFSGKIWVM